MRPIVLTIAGADPSGGAGIQADIKAIEAGRGYAASAITAVTVQNTHGVQRVWPLPGELVRAQIEAVLADLRVGAVKCGMLADESIAIEVAGIAERRRLPNLVVDPLLRSHDGFRLLSDAARSVLEQRLVPLARVVTPNVAEAEALAGMRVAGVEDAERAGRRILERGCEAVLVTGGHLPRPGTDVLVTRGGTRILPGTPLATRHTHGSGCTLASAIATRLAHGDAIEAAVERAKRFLEGALRHGLPVGGGDGPPDPFHELYAGGRS